MGIFNKIKNVFKKEEKKEELEEVKLYDEGLKKTRDNFVNKLIISG